MPKNKYTQEQKTEFVGKVQELRKAQDISVMEACQQIGITYSQYNTWQYQIHTGWAPKKKTQPALVSVNLTPKSDKDAILELLAAQFQSVNKTLAILRGE